MHHLIEQRIDNGRGYIRAALAASRDDIRRVPADEQLLRLDHVDKSDRHTDDERGRDNALVYQLVQAEERGEARDVVTVYDSGTAQISARAANAASARRLERSFADICAGFRLLARQEPDAVHVKII